MAEHLVGAVSVEEIDERGRIEVKFLNPATQKQIGDSIRMERDLAMALWKGLAEVLGIELHNLDITN